MSLSQVTFRKSSSLKRIGIRAFSGCALTEIHIPDSVQELCDRCFYRCRYLSRVMFGKASSLKLVGLEVFSECDALDIAIPDGVIRS